MMDKLMQKLKELKDKKLMGLMTHVVIGYPSLDKSVKLIKGMINSGVDLIELQMPFSDPLADGSTIMRANETAIKNDVGIKDCFKVMKDLSKKTETPLLFMGYYNTVFKYGTKRFIQDAQKAGATGLIIPDIPPEEESFEGFLSACKEVGLHSIRVLSPASTKERILLNSRVGSGFVYCVSHFGTTGTQAQFDRKLKSYLKRVRRMSNLPIAVGFGISKRSQIQALKGSADIAVVGSAVIERVEKFGVKDALSFVNRLR